MKKTTSLLGGQMAIELIGMALILNNGLINSGLAQEQIKLEWKFAKGQTTYYTNEQEMEIRDTVQGKVFTSSIGTSFKYKWTVVLETQVDFPSSDRSSNQAAGIEVSFGQIRHHISDAKKSVVFDSYRPIDLKELSTQGRLMQEEIERVAQTRFLFMALPDGGVLWPNSLDKNNPIAPSMKTPERSILFSPESFASSDSVVLPKQQIQIGDTWTVSSSDLPNDITKVTGKYRIVGTAVKFGHNCWQITGVTDYEIKAPTLDVNLRSYSFGPRLSVHYFDPEIGRLIYAEESTPIRMEFHDGRISEAVLKVRRQIDELPQLPQVQVVSRRLADGQNVLFTYRDGTPMNQRHAWLETVLSGLGVHGDQTLGNQTTYSRIEWSIVIDTHGEQIQDLSLIDVTGENEIGLEYRREDNSDKKVTTLWFDSMDLRSDEARWFHEETSKERIIKIIAQNQKGETLTLYQAIRVPLVSIRSIDGIVIAK